MKGLDWIVIDTETTGLVDPIYILEIYGQRMRNWKPIGPSFHAYLNHKVRIPADSTAVHGITKKFIDENPMKSLSYGKKVVLVGWSLGGATLTQVANRLHENGIAVKCLADRSFTNLPDVVIGRVSRLTGLQLDCMPMAFARAVVSQLLYHSFGEMDAGSAATSLNEK